MARQIRVGDRVELDFDLDSAFFVAAGEVRLINKHGRARIAWDSPWRMHTGLIPVADLKLTDKPPAVPVAANFPTVTTVMVDAPWDRPA